MQAIGNLFWESFWGAFFGGICGTLGFFLLVGFYLTLINKSNADKKPKGGEQDA